MLLLILSAIAINAKPSNLACSKDLSSPHGLLQFDVSKRTTLEYITDCDTGALWFGVSQQGNEITFESNSGSIPLMLLFGNTQSSMTITWDIASNDLKDRKGVFAKFDDQLVHSIEMMQERMKFKYITIEESGKYAGFADLVVFIPRKQILEKIVFDMGGNKAMSNKATEPIHKFMCPLNDLLHPTMTAFESWFNAFHPECRSPSPLIKYATWIAQDAALKNGNTTPQPDGNTTPQPDGNTTPKPDGNTAPKDGNTLTIEMLKGQIDGLKGQIDGLKIAAKSETTKKTPNSATGSVMHISTIVAMVGAVYMVFNRNN